MKKIALEGPINGCTDDECFTWRDHIIATFGAYCTFHNPMDFDCRGREQELESQLVAFDMKGLQESDIILVNAEVPGWGTAMAVQMCFDMKKPIISVCSGRVSPWLNNRSTVVVTNMREAITEIGWLIGRHIA